MVRSAPGRLLSGIRNLLHAPADQLQLKWLDVAPVLANDGRTGVREIVQDRVDGGGIHRERCGLETGVGHRSRPDDRLLRGRQIERRKPEARIQDLRDVFRGILEQAQTILTQRQHDPQRRRMLARVLRRAARARQAVAAPRG